MRNTNPFARLASFAVVLAVLTSSEALADHGTCGTGGAIGTNVNVPYSGSQYWIYVPSTAGPDHPLPLVVALHGDEGDPTQSIAPYWSAVWQMRQDFVLVMPKAPDPSGSWWTNYPESAHWMDAFLPYLYGAYNVDSKRVYLWGFSGGGCFLSAYLFAHDDTIAGVSINVGGCLSGATDTTTSCLVPVRLITGGNDFLHDQTVMLAQQLQTAGHVVDLVDTPGLGHVLDPSMFAPTLDWLEQRSLCGQPSDSPGCDSMPSGSGGSDAGTGGDGSAGGSRDSHAKPTGCGTTPSPSNALGVWIVWVCVRRRARRELAARNLRRL